MKMVELTLTGRQQAEGGEETVVETVCLAEYYERNDSIYILYQELSQENGAVVHNCIKLKNSVLEITRKGPLASRMVFEAGREHLTDYATPYGCMKMGILTHQILCQHGEEDLTINASYTLTSYGQPFSHCSVAIKLRPRDS